jgi:hypothetical protein
MKLYFLFSSFLLCSEAATDLYPVNIGQVQRFNNENRQIIRRNADQETKSFNVTLECSGPQCKKVSDTIDKLTNALSSFIQVKNQIKVIVGYMSYCEGAKLCNITDGMKLGMLL